MWQLTQQNYIVTIPHKGSQVIDSPASTFEGSEYREIEMVNSYNQYKGESLRAKRYTLQSLDPMQPHKNVVHCHHNFSQVTGHVEGSCMGNDILITSANCNRQNCKPRCIYQVLKFPNQTRNRYSGVHFFLRLSSA